MQKFIVMAIAIFSLVPYPAVSHAQSGLFTVMDSVQMVHFNDPEGNSINPPVWNMSPNGLMVLLVTTKGIVASDTVESTLWTLDLRATAKYLEQDGESTLPPPKEIVTVRGQLRAFQGGSYGSLITDTRWASDSKTIYMLIEQEGGRRELDKVDITTRHRETLSEKGHNVDRYEIDSRGVLYSAAQLQGDHPGSGESKAIDVIDTVRGRSIQELLWPSQNLRYFLFRSDRNGVRRIAPAPTPMNGDGTLSISPDGTEVIALVPVQETPTAWKPYIPGRDDGPLYRSAAGSYPVREYELVDLHTNSRRPLLGSPSGSLVGYYDATLAVWSSKGDHALITNTYLPLDHETQKEQEARRRPCAAAYVNMDDGDASCIVFARSSKEHESTDSWAIHSLRFGRTDYDVVLNLSWRGRLKTECYSLKDGAWSENSTGVCDATIETLDHVNRLPVRLTLLQSLNEPPTLWAEDTKNSHKVQIWNPNSQIAAKLSTKASVYHWLDKDKREWTGGLILPQGYKSDVQYPLVIQTHGFNPEQFLVDGASPTAMAARPLAAAGFVVLQIQDKYDNNRTSEEARLHINGYASAIDQLAKSGLIDPKRVGIIGFSRTSWFVEETLLELPERFAAAVIADGVDQSYVQYLLITANTPSSEAADYNGGKPIGKDLETWIKSAPGFRLSELKTPLRIQAISPLSLLWEWEIYASLRIQNKPVDMLYLPLGDHVLQNPAELVASEQGDVDWFRFWLQSYERPNPEDPDQYKRWEHLRELRDVDAKATTQSQAGSPKPN